MFEVSRAYQATMLVIVINCLRLSFIVAMAMVVMGGTVSRPYVISGYYVGNSD